MWGRGATPVATTDQRYFGPPRSLMRDGGLAVAVTDYRSDTPLARDAADDADQLRQVFVARFGRPKRSVIWGNSFGGLVAARCAERHRGFDGAVASCGLVAGSLRAFYPQVDLRVVYQHYCRNLPRPTEAHYPLWLGLDSLATLTSQELQDRVNECTGIALPAAQRSAAQRQNLANIIGVLRIPESGLLTNMDASTFLLRTFVGRTLGGRNPFANASVQYRGSDDDAALNRDVPRYTADAAAVTALATADDPTGRPVMPVVTLHAIDDSRAFVENESAYREAFARSGTLGSLFQAYTNAGGHCQFGVPANLAVLDVLLGWIETRTAPTQAALAAACERYRAEFGGSCPFNATFRPASFDSRVYPR